MAIVKLENITFEAEGYSIRNFNFTFEEGKLYGVLAPPDEPINLLLKLIAGILQPSLGYVRFNDIDMNMGTLYNLRDIRKKISYIFERGSLLANLSVLENLLLPYDYHFNEVENEVKLEKISYYFNYFQLSDKILNERPAILRQQTLKLVVIIRALLTEPEFLILDMPFTDLELRSKKRLIRLMQNLVRGQKTTQLFFSNSDILYDQCDTCLVFNQGELISQGTWDDLIQSEITDVQKIVKDYFEIELDEA